MGAAPADAVTRYVETPDGVHLAYQVFGEGPVHLVLIFGYLSHIELCWEEPRLARLLTRLGRIARVVMYDKRGEGLSDRGVAPPTLEVSVADLRTVVDAVDADRVVLLGMSQGGPVAVLYTTMYPERTDGLVLYGAMPRTVEAPDYPWAAPVADVRRANAELIAPAWGTGATLDTFAPTVADDPDARAWMARFERTAASPGLVRDLFLMSLDSDVRDLLPAIRTRTLVLHQRGDRAVSIHGARWMAAQIPGARLVELPGVDHQFWWGDHELFLAELTEFVTGRAAPVDVDRVLRTVMITDIVGSTEHLSAVGDDRWRDMLDAHDAVIRREVSAAGGEVVSSTGDGALATFDSPSRAVRAGHAVIRGVGPLGLSLRVGVHAGEVERRGSDVSGIGVHLAARIAGLAEADEVWVSRTVADLVAGSGLRFEPRGEHALKGVPGTWTVLAAFDPAG